MDFRSFVSKLEKEGKLVKAEKELSINLELAKFVHDNEPKPVMAEAKESGFAVAGNIFDTKELVAEFLSCEPSQLTKRMMHAIEHPSKPQAVVRSEAPVLKNEIKDIDLSKLPIPLHLKKDGGKYFTSAVVFAKDPEYGQNASFHRMMVIGKDKVVARILPRHLHKFMERAEARGGLLDIAFAVGLPVQALLAGATSLELGVDELQIANTLMPLKTVRLENGIEVPADSEFVYLGRIIKEEVNEGPFLDLTGTYDIVRKQRIIKIEKIYHRDNPIHHVLLPGGAEHKILMGMPREPTIFREVSKVTECTGVNLTMGGCSWLHAAVSIRKKSDDDAKKAIDAAFKGHASLKHVMIVDDDINVNDMEEVEWAIATRVQADKKVYILPNQLGSSLDPSADPMTRKTAKMGIDATAPLKKEGKDFTKVKW